MPSANRPSRTVATPVVSPHRTPAGAGLRPSLAALPLSPGKRARLHRLLYDHGPGGGTLLVLPIDQGLEHGPVDFFENPDALDPDYQFRLAREGRFSAIAVHIGLAQKYYPAHAGRIPLILKLNGKTSIPPDHAAFSALTGTVEEGVRLGADAVGYTLYVGSPAQDRDFAQLQTVRADCERYGMPLVIWAYPRGESVSKKGGKESLYAVDYAARVAMELGADIVKLNYPVASEKDRDSPAPYSTMALSPGESFRKVVQSAGRAFVLVSGGEKVDDNALLAKVRSSLEAGATGFIFGRNLWQRPWKDAIELSRTLHGILREFAEPAP